MRLPELNKDVKRGTQVGGWRPSPFVLLALAVLLILVVVVAWLA